MLDFVGRGGGGEAILRRPDNQKADPFSRTRPESFDDLQLFLFLSRDSF